MGFVKELRDFVTSFSFPDNFLGFWGSAPSEAGVTVNEMSAMQSAAIAGVIRIISGLLASLPINVLEVSDSGKKTIATQHDLQYFLTQRPNSETDAFMLKETEQVHLLLQGNGYIEIARNGAGDIAGLYQRSPFRTYPYRVMDKDNRLIFRTSDGRQNGTERIIEAVNMVHIKGLSMDGLVGLNPIKTFAREVVGLDLASRAFGARLFANDATPSGVVTTDKLLKDDHRKKLEVSWQAGHSGSQAHKFAVLDGGLKYQKISLSPEESQFLLTRGFQRDEISAIYGVPSHMLGGAETRGVNIEQQMLQFLNFTLKPWLRRWESALSMKLLPNVGRNAGRFVIQFDTSEMERADFETTLKAISTGRQWGIYTADEARSILRLNPFEPTSDDPADQLWQSVNMMIAQSGGDEPVDPPGQNDPGSEGGDQGDGKAKEQDDKNVARAISAYSRVFTDAFNRVFASEKRELGLLRKAFRSPLFGLCDLIYMEADGQFAPGGPLPDEVAAFVEDYIGGMEKRAKEWKSDSHFHELERAVRAVRIAVYREVSTRKAKEKSKNEPEAA